MAIQSLKWRSKVLTSPILNCLTFSKQMFWHQNLLCAGCDPRPLESRLDTAGLLGLTGQVVMRPVAGGNSRRGCTASRTSQ